ncbi:MAG: acyl-ACP--UDP-N-acetylglucosamine O-acyltransferase [Acidobacteriota bacterium]
MIHPTAIVSSGADLGKNVSIGAYAIIGDDVVLGDEAEVASHVVIEGPTTIGRETRIFPFACIGKEPQDLKFNGERTTLIVGERNVIREHVTMHRGTTGGGGVTSVGDDNLFMAQAHVAHDCHLGSDNVLANCATLAGHVEVEDHITIGAFCGVHQFCRVGAYAFIGGYSVVVKDALPYARTVGNHARCYGPNSIGLRRQGFSDETIRTIRHAFFLLLSSKLNTTQALERIKAEMTGISEIDYLIEFIEQSKRGVIKK